MKLWIMQGLPGSGKSSRAKVIVRENLAVILSTDDYHHNEPEPHLYKFNRERAAEFHKANQERCSYFMIHGIDIVIDNTNLTNRAVGPYVRLAVQHGYEVEFVHCNHAGESIHGVPAETMEKMRAAMEPLDFRTAFYSEPI